MYNNENLLKIESDSMTGNIGSGITLRSQENRTAYWFQQQLIIDCVLVQISRH